MPNRLESELAQSSVAQARWGEARRVIETPEGL
jgi:hypothetical protein